MITFWLAVLFLLVIALLIVWRIFTTPKHAIGAENTNIRQETNVTLYHEHLSLLEHDLAAGSIEQESFLHLKAELDKTLLQDSQVSQPEAIAEQKQSWFWPLGIAITLVSFSLYSYMKLGAYPLLNAPVAMTESDAHSDMSPEQMLAFRLQQLEREVETNPTNSQAWFGLGQAYISVGEFGQAIAAFDRVIEQVGEHAELLGPKAQAMYYKNNQQIDANIQVVIDKALALDSLDASTNILLGMDSFSHQKFADAIRYWERVLNNAAPDMSTDALADAVAEAKYQLSMSNSTAPQQTINNDDDSSLPELVVEVALAANVENILKSAEDKTVFIYAIASEGPRMPLAAVKVKASDLPIRIVLDDSKSMTPQMRLSNFDVVNIYAVVSMQGNVGIKPGDYKAQKLNVNAMEKSPIVMEIADIVE